MRHVFALREDVHRQDRHDGRGPDRQTAPEFNGASRRRQTQDARHREQGGRGKQQKLGIDHMSRIDAENARQRHARQIGEGRHRRVDLDDIAIEMLAIQHAFAHHQQPAHIGVQGNDLPQQDGDEEHQPVKSNGIGASPSRPADAWRRAEGSG